MCVWYLYQTIMKLTRLTHYYFLFVLVGVLFVQCYDSENTVHLQTHATFCCYVNNFRTLFWIASMEEGVHSVAIVYSCTNFLGFPTHGALYLTITRNFYQSIIYCNDVHHSIQFGAANFYF